MTSLIGDGSAAGGQAQTNILLQHVAKIADSLQKGSGTSSQVFPWTGAGNLDLATGFPNATGGIVSIRQTVPAAISVTLTTQGPWTIGDGAGVAATDNITVLPPAGYTIKAAANDVINVAWRFRTYILDTGTTNFIVTSSS